MTNGGFLWSLVVIFFMVVYFMILFTVIIDVFRSHDMGGWAKALWLIALLVVPVLTMLVYVITRGDGMTQRQADSAVAAHQAQVDYAKQLVGTSGSPTDQIAQAQSLLASGAITQAEFDALKAKALA